MFVCRIECACVGLGMPQGGHTPALHGDYVRPVVMRAVARGPREEGVSCGRLHGGVFVCVCAMMTMRRQATAACCTEHRFALLEYRSVVK